MTLGIACVTPWGLARSIAARLPPPLVLSGGVTVAIDSRYSRGEPPAPARDDGAKTWFLAPGIVAILAGAVGLAEVPLARLSMALRDQPVYEPDQLADLASRTFQRVIRHHHRRGAYRTEAAIAVGAPDGSAYLIHLDSLSDFSPAVGIEDVCIGDSRLFRPYWTALRERSKLAFDDVPFTGAKGLTLATRPEDLAPSLGACLYSFAEGTGGSIGGPVQVAYAQNGVTHTAGLYRGNTSTPFERVSAARDEVVGTGGQRRERHRRYPSDFPRPLG